jgi:hypothetical protein
MLLKRFLQRDISIGNVLLLDPPVETDRFAESSIEQLMARLSLQGVDPDKLSKYLELVEKMTKGLDRPNKCCGFVIDGDMAADLNYYFTSREMGEKSVGMPNCVGNLTDVIPRREHTSSCPGNWCAL